MLDQHTSLVPIKSFESSQLFLNFVQNFEKTVMTQKVMRLRFTLKIQKIIYFENQRPFNKQYTAAVSLFESSLAQPRSNEDLEGPECSQYYQNSASAQCTSVLQCRISPLAFYIYIYILYMYIYIYIYMYIYIYIYIRICVNA